jgi:hypothetical protein
MEALSNLLNNPFFGLALVIITGALIVPTYRALRHRQQGNRWPEFAARQGLAFDSSNKTISGQYRGKPVNIDVYYVSSGAAGRPTSQPMTRVAVTVANASQGYLNASIGYGIDDNQLAAANRLAASRGMNMHYVHTGDKEIDRKVAISAPSGGFADRVLAGSDSIRQAVLSTSGTLILEGQQLRYEWSGIESKAEKLQFALDLVSDMAEVIERI